MSSIGSIDRNHQAAQRAAQQTFKRRRNWTLWKPLLAVTIAGAVVLGVWMGGFRAHPTGAAHFQPISRLHRPSRPGGRH
jgi:hypothetical protein